MRELPDGREPKHAAVALNRMGGPEDPAQEVQIVGTPFELQETFLDRGEVLGGFLEKGVLEFRQVGAHG